MALDCFFFPRAKTFFEDFGFLDGVSLTGFDLRRPKRFPSVPFPEVVVWLDGLLLSFAREFDGIDLVTGRTEFDLIRGWICSRFVL